MTEPQVYIRGQTVPASQAHVAIFDAAVVGPPPQGLIQNNDTSARPQTAVS